MRVCALCRFDIRTLDRSEKEKDDVEGIEAARRNLAGLVDMEENEGISRERIILGGFSQGGSVAVNAVLKEKGRLGCCLALSTFVKENILTEEGGEKCATPFLQCHGEDDEMISIDWGRLTRDLLKARVSDFTYQEYANMGHEGTEAELQLVKEFIQKHVPEI